MTADSGGNSFAALVRDADPARYFANQFAASDKRDDLFVLYAFDLEIRKIPQTVRESMAGEIRLQWWREVFNGERDEEAEANPMARASLSLVRKYQIDPTVLGRYLDGRIFDLYSDQIQDIPALEAYAGQTEGTILQLACLILDRDQSGHAADLSGYLSCASCLWTRVVRPLNGNASDQAIRYLPPGLVKTAGLDTNPFLDAAPLTNAAAISIAIDYAESYLKRARETAAAVPTSLRPAFLHMSQIVASLEAAGSTAPTDVVPRDPATFRLIWRLWRASKKWPCF
ncbi:MAG: squalene/phytoene synthase family protein [Hyphomicrobiales bacterium]